MFALFEDDFILFVRRPQASLPSAAQPAVMDIRRLRRRLLEIDVHNILSKVQFLKNIDLYLKSIVLFLKIIVLYLKKRRFTY